MTGCTIALTNQLPQARVLAASFKQHHPGCRFAILLLDAHSNDAAVAGDWDVISWTAAGFRPDEARQLPMLYDAARLIGLAKPLVLRSLLATDTNGVIYIDVESEIYAPFEGLDALLETHPAVMPPAPQSQRPEDPNVDSSAQVVPLPLVAVRAGAVPFLSSWSASERLRMGLAPVPGETAPRSVGEPYLQRDIGWSLGFWNVGGHKLTRESDRYSVDAAPLRCFHFCGYEPHKPHLLSRPQGLNPRVLLSEAPTLAELCEEHRQKLVEAGWDASVPSQSRLDFLPGGVRIDELMRSLYRAALSRFQRSTGPEPQSPFGPGGEGAFLGWLNQNVAVGSAAVTRYMSAIHAARPDLQAAFPDILDADARAFRTWFRKYGCEELQVPAELLPDDLRKIASRPARGRHVNVVGFFNAELGLGEAARLLATALDVTDTPFNTIAYDGTANRQDHHFHTQVTEDSLVDINIVCINSDQFQSFAEKTGSEFFDGRYTIGVWFWEVEDFPEEFHGAFNYVDEIWVASEFVRAAFLKVSPKPVYKFHLPIVRPPTDESLSRAALGIADAFTFLFSFDFLSVLERKNPLGLIEAFKRAFKPGEGPILLLKTINGVHRVLEMEKLKFAARHRPDIQIIDGYLSAVEKNTLTARCDCYVSLHRSEGFGLTMAEAMALGRPVIATGYSGNMEFMNAANSYLCEYAPTTVGPERQPYPADSRWAEPDVAHAAALLRQVYTDQADAGARGRCAAEEVERLHSPAVAAATIADRIRAIRQRRSRASGPRGLDLLDDRVTALEASQREILARLQGASTRRAADALPSDRSSREAGSPPQT